MKFALGSLILVSAFTWRAQARLGNPQLETSNSSERLLSEPAQYVDDHRSLQSTQSAMKYDTVEGACDPISHVSGLITVSNINECADACEVNSRCNAFRTNGQRCYLKGECGGTVGPCSADWCSYRVQAITRYETLGTSCDPVTHIGGAITVSTHDACAEECERRQGCNAFDTNGLRCFLKGLCGGLAAPCSNRMCSYRKPQTATTTTTTTTMATTTTTTTTTTSTTTTTTRLSPITKYVTFPTDCSPVTHMGGKLTVTSRHQCAQECESDLECNAFRTDGITCYLKSVCGGEAAPCSQRWCSFRKQAIRRYASFPTECNPVVHVPGKIMVTSRNHCAEECEKNPECKAFRTNGESCWLKGVCGGERAPCSTGWCSYRKVDSTPTMGLRALAAVRGDFLIGVGGLDMSEVDNPTARAVLTQHFNTGTAGNVCKYGLVQRTPGNYNFDACDEVRNLIVDTVNGKFRLHALAWGNQNRPWLFQLSPSEKRQNLIDSIKETVTHYGADSWAIDVVNEAITDCYTDRPHCSRDALRTIPQEPFHAASQTEHLKDYGNLGGVASEKGPHPWYPDVPDYVDLAFIESRKHCSKCKLFYNDYSAEGSGGPTNLKVKSDRVYEYVMGMLERKVPIDGVGFQFHIHMDSGMRPTVSGIKANIQRFADLGLEVHITEMDIKVSPPWTKAKEREQAKLYAEVLHACWTVPKCTAFIVWGLRDADSWLVTGTRGETLEVTNPLLFDDTYAPKLAVPYMMHVMQNKGVTWTSVDA